MEPMRFIPLLRAIFYSMCDLLLHARSLIDIAPKIRAIRAIPSNVLALDAQSFETVVMNSSMHALVEFYAPWCGVSAR